MMEITPSELTRNDIGTEITIAGDEFPAFEATIQDLGPSPRLNGFVIDLESDTGEYQLLEHDDGTLHLFIESNGLPHMGEVSSLKTSAPSASADTPDIPFLTA